MHELRRAGVVIVVVVVVGGLSGACGNKGGEATKDKAKPAAGGKAGLGAAPARVVTGECGGAEAIFESGPAPRVTGGFATGFGTIGSGDFGTIGSGQYGTIGHGSGTGSGGYRVGYGSRAANGPSVTIGNTASVTGELDKAIVRRYVRRSFPQLTFCYEKELLLKPKLQGTINTAFTIDGSGAVTGVTASGLGDEKVEACVAAALGRILFPKPKDGGKVAVKYPLVFKPGDGKPGGGKPDGADPGHAGKGIIFNGDGVVTLDGTGDPSAGVDAVVADAAPAAPAAPAPVVVLARHTDALGTCLAEQAQPWGVAVLELAVDAGGKVTSAKALGLEAGASAAAECLAKVATAATVDDAVARGQTIRCPIAWGAMPLDALPHVDIDERAVTLDGKPVVDVEALLAPDNAYSLGITDLKDPLQQRRAARAAAKRPVALSGPLIVRPVSTTRARALLRVWMTAYIAEERPVLAVKGPKGWTLLSPVDVPVVPVAESGGGPFAGVVAQDSTAARAVADPPAQLVVLVTVDGVWIGTTTGERRQVLHKDGAPDLAAVRVALTELKKGAHFVDRRDAEVSLEDPATYGTLVPVLGLLTEVGFGEWAFTTPAALSVGFTQ